MNDTIYSAEQIEIPQRLPEILKEYSKAILAEEPADLVDFSVKYFGKLKSIDTKAEKTSFKPNLDQMYAIYKEIKDKPENQQIDELAKAVPEQLVSDLKTWLEFGKQQLNLDNESAVVTVTLLLCLIETQMYDVLNDAFFVFRNRPGVISKDNLLAVFDVLCKFDYRVEKTTIDIINGLENEVQFDDLTRLLGVRK